ncbi:nuclease-related domain-containing protein [Romboutsia lituseburensis]|uniref:nuclease-related domain-containing protein n=1 Tax=Romboutsia lituseburensis TaxID=1537 RepID=UPI00215B764E|nr:NERD domain-containing protein [Romboutsia lituseburensis]MCR8743817.1 NERD domain-containing protein [Romboutsia lituseburensis]
MNIEIPIVVAGIMLLFTSILIIMLSFYIYLKSINYRQISGIGFYQMIHNAGNFGEYLVYKEIENLNGNFKVLTNLYIPVDHNRNTEIDMILIHENGIFVIESKNYSGCIYGKEFKKEWLQVLDNGFRKKFYNPIFQNKNHIKHLTNTLKFIEDEDIYSLIIFSERCNLKPIEISNCFTKVIKRNQLLQTISVILNSTDVVFSKEDIETIYNILIKFTKVSDEVKKKHVEMIKSYNKK